MAEKIYSIDKNQLDKIHFTKEKLMARIRNEDEDVNVCWVTDDEDFNKSNILYFKLFNRKTKNNLLKNRETVINMILKKFNDDNLEYTKAIFHQIHSTENIDTSFSYRQYLEKYDDYFYLTLAYFILEKCPGTYLAIGPITISYKLTKEMIAVNFWDKLFK